MQLLWRFLRVVGLFAGFGADFAILSLKKWRFSQSKLKQQYNAIYHSQAYRFRLRAVCFAQIDPTPLAAASLGQVHLTKLHSGEKVAVKVQRPGIGRLINVDLRAIRLVLFFIRYFTKWGKTLDIDAIYLEFKRTILRELDYEEEGSSAERFQLA